MRLLRYGRSPRPPRALWRTLADCALLIIGSAILVALYFIAVWLIVSAKIK